MIGWLLTGVMVGRLAGEKRSVRTPPCVAGHVHKINYNSSQLKIESVYLCFKFNEFDKVTEPSTDIEGEVEEATPEPTLPTPLHLESPLDHLVHRRNQNEVRFSAYFRRKQKESMFSAYFKRKQKESGFSTSPVPENYVFTPEERQKKLASNKSIPVIDLASANTYIGLGHDDIVKQIFEAGKEFGIFQIVNHGVNNEVMSEMLEVVKEFFNMPLEARAIHYSEDLCKPETVERYAVEMKGLTEKIFGLITEGLGLEYDYLNGGLSGQPMVSHMNYFPPCPDPSLTFDLAKHCDSGLVTLLLQGDVSGLQILCKGEWRAVDLVPNAIIVIYGHQMEFVSNGQLKSVEHRAITNDMQSRISIATFIQPAKDCLVAPAKKLLDEKNPPLYKSFLFDDYFTNYVANLGDKQKLTEHFQNKETIERYAVEMKGLTEKIFGLITEGLGLEYDYLNGGLSGEPMVSHVNYYPPCPDPSLTLGLAKHCDPGLVTLLLQGDVSGLQILCNGEWRAVDPVPNAIIVIYGHQMECMRLNKKFKMV
ncbi:hypothetical protein IEQ34_006082 [Dendrobium chrysotoxum]|uniref:Fe2OG dioxygenase domain-containing protein n=1 Tax=Dendrobium chrysotoxum TaxID=161865 RepID=A0AAV7HDZ9_DENCH|nr:hypothetical protein IEQ34_006082 [Dendrobium chrysotoxum]